ncbi:MAG: hypothetical protein QHI48_01630 [Bacteroidota bacterium]|nr:hypothetical protein [Bacteroidota bacterium]
MHRRELPTIFLRLFLSHLLLLFIACSSAFTVFSWLFAPGVSLFLRHSPVVLLPVILALIGIAGLLALWTANAIRIPLQSLPDSIKTGIEKRIPNRFFRVQEIAELVLQLSHRAEEGEDGEMRAEPEQPLMDTNDEYHVVVTVDNDFLIRGILDYASDLLSLDPFDAVGKHFLDVFEVEERRVSSHAALLRILDEGRRVDGFETLVRLETGDILPMQWFETNLFDPHGAILGKRLYGRLAPSVQS